MKIKLIHTSDWQIGKVFRFLDDTTMGLLQEARLGAITRIGELAREHGARHVLVAGDVYDMEALSPRSLNQPLERMRVFADVQWHLLPGNHDPHRPNGLWDRLLGRELPDNVHAHLRPAPVNLEEGLAVLLPAPLSHRHVLDDPTAYMDDLDLPEGVVRIGLAHGSVTGFGSGDSGTHNRIAPDRPGRAGLAYLALGDWHGQRKINDRCWYSGTPETDAFDVIDGGQALLVEVEGPGAVPAVLPISTGQYTWPTRSANRPCLTPCGPCSSRSTTPGLSPLWSCRTTATRLRPWSSWRSSWMTASTASPSDLSRNPMPASPVRTAAHWKVTLPRTCSAAFWASTSQATGEPSRRHSACGMSSGFSREGRSGPWTSPKVPGRPFTAPWNRKSARSWADAGGGLCPSLSKHN